MQNYYKLEEGFGGSFVSLSSVLLVVLLIGVVLLNESRYSCWDCAKTAARTGSLSQSKEKERKQMSVNRIDY